MLDCLDAEQAPFSKGTLVGIRKRLIETHMDRRLIERTIEPASQNQGFGSWALWAALDSSPLWGAGRIEDTYNLVGHALQKVLQRQQTPQGRDQLRERVAVEHTLAHVGRWQGRRARYRLVGGDIDHERHSTSPPSTDLLSVYHKKSRCNTI